jgi:hypothetical protein
MTYNKLVLLHEYISNESLLISSFKDDSKIIQTNNETKLEDILGQIQEFKSDDGTYPFNHLTFVYHFPGYHSVPFLETVKEDSSGNLLDNKYHYFNDEIIDLIKELGNELTVDLLSCDLKDDNFKEEVANIEEDLNINIRYSVDQTGNNPQGNWVLESDSVDVKDLYFSETIDQWSGVLTGSISPYDLSTNFSDYFSWDGTTLKLLQNIEWPDLSYNITINDRPQPITKYITLEDNQVFDGQGYTIDLSTNFTTGLFASTGTSIDDGPVIKNLGVLGGSLISYGGYFVISRQTNFTVYNCYSTGNISASFCGGICASLICDDKSNSSAIIEKCHSTGDITGSNAGGICGNRCGYGGGSILTIKDCYSIGIITGTGAGGISGNSSGGAGMYGGSMIIERCYSTGNISGINAGGIGGDATGYQGSVFIRYCYSTGNITGTGAGGTCGSNCGYFYANHRNGICNISNCYSTGIIQGQNAGGICGINSKNTNINHCYSSGIIQGQYAGGICGKNSGSYLGTTTINNCYSIGNITGDNAGGIAGSEAGANSSNDPDQRSGKIYIYNCYSTGTIDSSASSAGGITGSSCAINYGSCTINNCYSINDDRAILGALANYGVITVTNSYGDSGGTGNDNTKKQNGNYLLTDISNNSGIGELGNEYIVSFTNNYQYPILKSNTGIGINGITYYDFNKKIIRLNQSVSFNDLKNDFIHNSNDFNHFILGDEQVFDGQGHTIDLDTNSTAGLFASTGNSIDSAPLIKNLGVLRGTLAGGGGYIVKAYQRNFKVDNCYSTGNIADNGGGIVGQYATYGGGYCIINKCYSTGSINYRSGGIVGLSAGRFKGNCIITNCYSTGEINGNESGGITGDSAGVGKDKDYTIVKDSYCYVGNCYSTGAINGNSSGGIVASRGGEIQGTCVIENCYSTGDISGDNTGGITGGITAHSSGNVTIKNCYSIGNITGTDSNGIIGHLSTSNPIVIVNNCYSQSGGTGNTILNGNYLLSNLSGIGELGDEYTLSFLNNYNYPVLKSNLGAGLITYIDNTILLNKSIDFDTLENALNHNSTFTNFIVGNSQVFDGQGHTIDLGTNSTAGLFASTGTTIDNAPLIKNLGVLGGSLPQKGGYIVKKEQKYFKVDNCYSTGVIHNNGGGIVGGSAGYSYGHCIISNCYSTGNISYRAGGIIGDIGGTIYGKCYVSNCYSTGNIDNGGGGGISGDGTAFNNGNCYISNCYSTGNIGGFESGGITGRVTSYLSGNCIIENCYSIGDITGKGIVGTVGGSGGTVTATNCYSQSGGTGDALHGNYPLTDISNKSGIGHLGNEYIVSFLNNYQYPVLRSNLGAGLITSTNHNIILNKTVDFSILQNALNHNNTTTTTDDFTHFIPNNSKQHIKYNGNYVILSDNSNNDILNNTEILNVGNLQQLSYSDNGIFNSNFEVFQLKPYYDATTMKIRLYTATQLKKGPYSAKELKVAGFTIDELKNAGYKTHEIYQAGYPANEFLNGLSGINLINELKKLRANNYSVNSIQSSITLSRANYINAGYSDAELDEEGI